MASGNSIQKLFHKLIETTKKEPGLIEIKVTQQIGQPYNYTVIEQWKDKSSLDGSSATDSTKEFTQVLQPLLSGPVYQRVFNVFQ
jgi:quinol monooxygenase YgiN